MVDLERCEREEFDKLEKQEGFLCNMFMIKEWKPKPGRERERGEREERGERLEKKGGFW